MSYVSLMRTETGFLCAICFDHVRYGQGWRDDHGYEWDMCARCGEGESIAPIFCWMAGWYGAIQFGTLKVKCKCVFSIPVCSDRDGHLQRMKEEEAQ